MRVTARQINRNYNGNLNKAYSNYSDTVSRISSGYKITAASEDVAASQQSIQTRISKNKTDQQISNITNCLSEMNNTETTMSHVKSILTNINSELAVKAENGTTGTTGYAAIALQVRSLRDEIVQNSNQQYNNKYIFGGTNASTAPFTVNSSGYLSYNGITVNSVSKDASGNFVSGSPATAVPMDDKTYVDIGDGLTMTGNTVKSGTAMCMTYSGLDVFGYGTDSDGMSNNIINNLTDLANAIEQGDTTKITKYNKKLTTLADNFQMNVTDIGVKINALDAAQTRLQSLSDSYETRISDLIGVDDTKEATNESSQDYVLKAVLALGSKLLPQSLMDYVG